MRKALLVFFCSLILLLAQSCTKDRVGESTKEHAVEKKAYLELSAEVLTRLDEIWPGPGGQAPEAYAW